MEKIRELLYSITWAGRDVSKDVSPYLTSLTYTDNLHGKSDEIQMTFEDRDDRWKTSWYPSKGDVVKVKIGVAEDSEKWLNAGTFQIDEIEFSGPPDTINVKGLSTYVTEAFRQKRTHAWENVNLSKVILDIAKRNKLKPQIKINPDIKLKRLDQKDDSDLGFLKSVCEKYGYNVKVDAERLICVKPDELEESEPIYIVRRGGYNIITYRFSTKTFEIYKACEVRYWDPVSKKEVKHTETAKKVVSGGVLKISERCENKQQAIERARAELKKKNKWECESEITVMGEPYLTAGATVIVEGFGSLDGQYLIEEAVHTLSKGSGYTTSCKIRRVKEESVAKNRSAN
ncbi:phage late control D family protein [Dissulfurispira sp.]|uniref:phage late control D family protein n=1 Tax=Dissulfurispira sp. TaxID=2817609 RepID=UPI002FD89333